GLEGSYRWLHRVWHIAQQWRTHVVGGAGASIDAATLSDAERTLRRKTHETIRRVTLDIEVRKQFNTAIAAMMELVNELYAFTKKQESEPTLQAAAVARESLEALIVMLSPFAPHMAEELWEQFGHTGTLSAAKWPAFDA